MKAPKEFIKKVEEWKKCKQRSDELYEELSQWIQKISGDSCIVWNFDIVDNPKGNWQDEDEYCMQWSGYTEDNYSGNYYHKIEQSDKWFRYDYEC